MARSKKPDNTASKKQNFKNLENVLEKKEILKSISEILDQIQRPNLHHKKFFLNFFNLQEKYPIEDFTNAFIFLTNKLLSCKKDLIPNRVLKFLANYLVFAKDKIDGDENMRTDDDDNSSIITHFSEGLLKFYLPGLSAKDRVVRLRCSQLVAITIDFIGAVDEEFYIHLRDTLIDRSCDKESSFRYQIVIALSRLQDENDETDPVIDKLINILRTDPSADVRKCVIMHILQNEKTVPYLIERARDLDTNIRKWVFLKTMVDVGDFRLLSIKQREHLLKNGISDRDEGVKKSCLKMLSSHWMPTVGDDLLSLLEKLDVMNSDVAEVTLYAFFKLHPQVVSEFVIPENALDDLTSESSFLIKIILKYCNDNKMEEKLFNLLPSPMELASVLEKHHSLSVTCEDEVLKVEYDFIVLQLLEMGSMLDFADEAGRRKVYEMLRYLYSVVDENEDIIFQMAVVMKKLSNNELDFSRTMVEVVSDVCEEFGTNGDFKEQIGRLEIADYEDEEEETLSDEDARTLSILMKCLLLVKSTLQQCQLPLVKNTVLYGLLNDLVSPAVQSSIEVLRHSGLVCLGLYCMLDRDLSYKNFSVFVHSCQSDQDEYREHSLKIIFDLCVIYGIHEGSFKVSQENIFTFFKNSLKDKELEFQAIACQGLARLYMADLLADDDILSRLIFLYFVPTTQDSLKLRQSLHYFFSVYPRISLKNLKVVQKAFVPSLLKLYLTHKKISSKYQMITPIQVAQLLVDWTDPNNIENPSDEAKNVHGEIALELIKTSISEPLENRKLLVQTLSKLSVSSITSLNLIASLEHLISVFKENRSFPDKFTHNTFTKFADSITKTKEALKPETFDLSPEQHETPTMGTVDPQLIEFCENIQAEKANGVSKKEYLSKQLKREVDAMLSESSGCESDY